MARKAAKRGSAARSSAQRGERPAAAAQAKGQRPAQPKASRAELKARSRTLTNMRLAGVGAFSVLLVLGGLVGLLFFARPTTSEVEKRNLTTFPQFTLSGLLDGSFFSDVALWYSDTYPPREALVGMSQSMKNTYGIQPKTQLVGGNVKADQLPVADENKDKEAAAATDEEAQKKAEEAKAAAEQAKQDEGPVELPDSYEVAEAIQDKIMAGLYVDNGTAYNIYYFDQESVELYAEALNTCARNLAGEAHVYSILAPTSGGALLDESLLASLGGADQRETIRYFNSLYEDGVTGVPVYDALRQHRDEYIYFRTDHHWTELGAYYAYLELCKARGVTPSDIMGRQKMRFEPFLGTFYSELENADMEANPDYVDAWVPNSTNDMVIWDEEGNQMDVNVITDVSDWNIYSKYMCFISGDRPLTRIDNPTKTDGSSCLVIKDSFGCAFVPLLVDDYQTTWVIDFRYSDRSIPDFVRQEGIDDVIYMNALPLAGTYAVGEMLLAQAQTAA